MLHSSTEYRLIEPPAIGWFGQFGRPQLELHK